MPNEPLIFVHLSDIHFHSDSGSPDDLNDDIRQQLLRDLPEVCAGLGQASAVLVTGDIAYKASPVEYDYARAWLDRVCETLGLGTENVLTVPGNHDIDQSEQQNDEGARLARQELRTSPEAAIDDAITRCHRDSTMRQSLYRPLGNYNLFALPYESAIDGESSRWWETKPEDAFTLNDGSKLVIRGVNSVLISDKTDHRQTAPLVVGSSALTIPDQDGVTNLLMCHHPPGWLRDRTIDGPVAGRAKLQLFGHEHDQAVVRFRDSVRIYSGALHPDRGLNWRPLYNVISLSVRKIGERRILHVEVMARSWSRQLGRFGPDDGATDGRHMHDLELPTWSPSPISDPVITTVPEEREGAKTVALTPMTTEPSDESGPEAPRGVGPERRLAHRFYRLSIPAQWKIIRELGYIDLSNVQASSVAFFATVFARARADERLHELWKLVEKEHSTLPDATNPFEGR